MADTQQGNEVAPGNESQGGSKKGGAMKTMIFVALGALIITGANVGVTLYLSRGSSQTAAEANPQVAASPVAEKTDGPPVYVTFDPPFTVGFDDPSAARFLQIEMVVATRDPAVEDALKAHMPVVRNALVLLFSSQKQADLATREGKEHLRLQALAEMQRVLTENIGRPGVDDVYFTSFVMQ